MAVPSLAHKDFRSRAGFRTSFVGAEMVGSIRSLFPCCYGLASIVRDIRLAADWNLAPSLKLSVNPNIGVGRFEDDKGRLFTAGLFAMTLNYLCRSRHLIIIFHRGWVFMFILF